MLRDMFHTPFESLSVTFNPFGNPFSGGEFAQARGSAESGLMPALRPFHAAGLSDWSASGLSGAFAQPLDLAHTLSMPGRPPAPFQMQSPASQPVFGVGSPSMADEISYLNGIDGSGNVVGTSFWTWKGDRPATFANKSDVGKWGADHATTTDVVTVDYFFQTSAHWTATEMGVFQSCLALWSAVSNVKFNLVTDSADAEIVFKRGHDGSAYEFDSQDDSGGAGTIGDSTLFTKDQAVISVDTSVPGFGPIDGSFTAFGGYVWGTLVHEMGHALGLGHAGSYNGSVNPMTQQFSAYDSLVWTIMSYIDPGQNAKYDGEYPFTADWGTDTPTTWMPLDILAVQGLYGAPLTTPLDGGQTFGFNCNVGGDLQNFFDFTVNVNPIITIFSAGTGNTLDLSGFKTDSTIDLNPGTFSSCDGKTHNIAIAFDTVVETAIGGKGDDTFFGSDLANTLIGNKGGDTFLGGLGADTMNGGKGADVFQYTGVGESTGVLFDTVVGFDFDAADEFDFTFSVTAIDTKVTHGALTTAGFDGDLAAAITGAQLAAGDAVLFKPNSGDYVGSTFLVVDVNGTGGYQAGEDLVVLLDGVRHVTAIDIGDFI